MVHRRREALAASMANITVARKSGFIRRSGVMRRESLWLGITETANTITTASTAVLFAGFGATLLGLRPFTIVRTRIHYSCSSDQSAQAEVWGCAFGGAVVSDQASAIGVTAVPTPATDSNSDLWFFYATLTGRVGFASAVGFSDSFNAIDIDSKAMRKVEDGEDVAMSLETLSISNGVVAIKQGRMLLKLH